MTTHEEEEIDLTDITRNNSPPTLISITKARREISRQLQSRVCANSQTHDHGHSYPVWSNSDWLNRIPDKIFYAIRDIFLLVKNTSKKHAIKRIFK
jgi:hypothetical protein